MVKFRKKQKSVSFTDRCRMKLKESDFYAKLAMELKKLKGAKIYMKHDHPYGYEVCFN